MSKKIGILDPQGKHNNPLTGEPYSDKYKELAKQWSSLPAFEKANDVLKSLDKFPLTFIISMTGSGKTVLLPKLALHHTKYEGKVGVTLPKRSITYSTAVYAADTLDTRLGTDVGYVHKGSDKKMVSEKNKILYMTDGTLVAKILQDPDLSEFKVIVIDEAHERKVQIDLILLFIKRILLSGRRPDLRVVIMSATIDASYYQEYFSNIKSNIISISGEPNHPIDVYYLKKPNTDYLKAGTKLIDKLIGEGMTSELLFFITTSPEAIKICREIRGKHPDVFCVEVYSEMDPQMLEYAKSPDAYYQLGDYKQKVIMSTNLAESSLTIKGLKYVIDSCREYYSFYNPDTYGSTFAKRLITKAQALQRRGRVGRTSPGKCYHLLTEEEFRNLSDYPEPDILSSDITIILLQIILMVPEQTLDAGLDFMSQLMDPPSQSYVDSALRLYKLYNLLDNDKPTKISKQLVQFSSIPFNRILFLINSFHHHCLFEACSIVSMIEIVGRRIDNLFTSEPGSTFSSNVNPNANKWLSKNAVKKSDHLTLLKIYQGFDKATDRQDWANKNKIRIDLLRKARRNTRILFQKVLRIMRSTNVSLEEADMSRPKTQNNLTKKIIISLQQSHRHLTAKKMTAIRTPNKIEGKIDKTSVVTKFYKKKELANKTFIYDELAFINKNATFGLITIL